MDCWIESYKPDFKFIEQLDDMEKQLLSEQMINGTGVEEYQNLFKEIREDEREVSWDQLTINQYVNESRFKECASKSNLPNEDNRTIKYGLLFSIYHILSKDLSRIKVYLYSDERIAVNDEFFTIESFTGKMISEIDNLIKNGVPENEVTVSLKVDPQTKMNFVTEVLEKLKELKTKKKYSIRTGNKLNESQPNQKANAGRVI